MPKGIGGTGLQAAQPHKNRPDEYGNRFHINILTRFGGVDQEMEFNEADLKAFHSMSPSTVVASGLPHASKR